MIAELTNVTKFFDLQSGRAQKVLGGIDLKLLSGDTLAIVGSSGSGKSTLLNILGTLDKPTSGTVELFGRSVVNLSEPELAALRSRKLGFIFQLHHLLPQLTTLENVLVPTLTLPAAERGDKPARAKELLRRVGLEGCADKKTAQLSGGERQRAAVVRALINQPELLLADEPTGALDEENALGLTTLLKELNEELGTAIVLVTHDMQLARKMAKVARLRHGQLEWESVHA